jgi:Phosphatidyl serine synthase
VAALVWFSGALDPNGPPNEPNFQAAVMACAFVYLGYSTLQGPGSVMIRPHPTVWKFWHGCCMLYLLALVFMLVQGKDEARRMMKARFRALTAAFTACRLLHLLHLQCSSVASSVPKHSLSHTLFAKHQTLHACWGLRM